MNGETFADLLKHYARLYQMPLEELRTLAMQYPYVQNLQLLLQEKMILEGSGEDATQLSKTALYAVDRRFLQRKVQRLQQKRGEYALEAVRLADDYLELRDLNAVRADLEKISLERLAAEETPPLQAAVSQNEPGEFSIFDRSENPVPEDPEEETEDFLQALNDLPLAGASELAPIPNVSNEKELPAETSEETTLPAVEDQVPPAPKPAPKPLPKTAFKSWSQNDEDPFQRHLQDLLNTVPSSARKSLAPEDQITQKAMQSMVDKDNVASETWAKLLVRQAQYHKAIEVYERLILLFPEKSIFFAAEIESIKKLLS
jgi:hypothetical protein